MNTREFIRELIQGKQVERCGLWIGKPHKQTLKNLGEKIGVFNEEKLHRYFKDEVRWITPHYMKSTYSEPNGRSMRYWKDLNPHASSDALLAGAQTVDDVHAVEWPDVTYLKFDECLSVLNNTGDYYRLSGFWCPFYHDLTYLFGTEELLIKMMLQPEIVNCALEYLCNFYLQANELFYKQSKGLIDALFFGNDFGSQKDLMISPEQFEIFFLPWIKKFADQAHAYNLHTVLHSCGSIYRIIPQLIEAGVDAIHPVQSKAGSMDADKLSKNFQGKIAFIGGIDTQEILTNGSPEQVFEETLRVKRTLGNNIIIGPAHEVLMPDVPFENIRAMCEAAKEK